MEKVVENQGYLQGPTKQVSTSTQPPSLFLFNDLITYLHNNFLPEYVNLSLVSKFFNSQYKEVFFFPLLRTLPEVKRQIDQQIPIIKISQEMKLTNGLQLAQHVAQALTQDIYENDPERFVNSFATLEALAKGGCPRAQFELGILFDKGVAGIEQDHTKARLWLLKVAPHSSYACTLIAAMAIYYGEANFQEANTFLKQAIKLNPKYSFAYKFLGDIYSGSTHDLNNITVPAEFRNDLEAMQAYQRAAKLGDEQAVIRFGEMIVADKTVSGDQVELAFDYLRQAGPTAMNLLKLLGENIIMVRYDFQTNEPAMSAYLIGLTYCYTELTFYYPRDRIAHSEKSLCKAATMGCDKTLFKVVDLCLKENKFAYENTTNNHSTANTIFKSVRALAKKGHPEANYTSGLILMHRQSHPLFDAKSRANHYFKLAVENDKHPKALEIVGEDMRLSAATHLTQKKYSDAYETYAALARAGDAEAKQQIVFMLMGKLISEVDDELFLLCFEHEANRGNAGAAFELANWHMNRPYLKRNPEEAMKWYKKAYELGNNQASFELGTLYLNKSRFDKSDAQEAQRWFEIAVKDNIKGAQEKLNEVNKKLESWFLF